MTILVEVDDIPESTGWGKTRSKRVTAATRDVFGDGLALTRDCAARTAKSIEETAEEIRPDEFEVQLAVKLDAEAGAVLAKIAAGADAGDDAMETLVRMSIDERLTILP